MADRGDEVGCVQQPRHFPCGTVLDLLAVDCDIIGLTVWP